MVVGWAQAIPVVSSTFLASLVEFVEAATIVLAVGVTRGWRSAFAGSAAAVAVLVGLVGALGPLFTELPRSVVQVGVGLLTLLFGLRWLRKAVLRAAGVLPLHDEAGAYLMETLRLRTTGEHRSAWDWAGVTTSFQITLLEGIEVVFIVVAVGAGQPGLLGAASAGAAAAFAVVVVLAAILNRPLARVPENTLKFVVGVLLCGFGTFWVGEGTGLAWPGSDWSLAALIGGFLLVALAAVRLCRMRSDFSALDVQGSR